MDALTYIGTGIGSIVTFYVIQNSKLKDGVTDTILNLLGKFGSKKIDLKNHKAFIILKNYKNQLNLFLFDNHTKSTFYKEFIGIIFENILLMTEAIIKRMESGEKVIEYAISEEIEACRTRIDNDLINKLLTPEKITNQIDHWKTLMLSSLKNSIESLITDETNNEDYFKVYRTLDALLSFCNFVTSTGSILFNNINGAFKDIEVSEIYKHNNKDEKS